MKLGAQNEEGPQKNKPKVIQNLIQAYTLKF